MKLKFYKSKELTQSDVMMLRRFCFYVLDHFISKKKQKDVSIIIWFRHPSDVDPEDQLDLDKYLALMYNFGNNRFGLTINSKVIGRSKNQLDKLKDAMQCIGHELVHVKQYVNGEMRDYVNGDVWWHGQWYTDWKSVENYYDSPWEIEAYGREGGLYEVFKLKHD